MVQVEKDKIEEFVKNASQVLEGEDEGGYCIIVYVSGLVRKVYKSIDDFKAKIENDTERIDPMFDIEFQVWLYD